MAERETTIVQQCRLNAHKYGMTLFRNNCGKLEDKRGRWVTFGLCIGSGDLIGWKSVIITPEMVGQRVAIFTSAEGKSEGKGLTDRQKNFRDAVREAGGIAGVVHCPDDLGKL